MIVVARPPNFELIRLSFPDAEKPGVLFAHGETIFNPSGVAVPPVLIEHEKVHLKRQQLHGPDLWWDHYIRDDEFRYREELHSHVAEYKYQRSTDRNFNARLLVSTALRLVAPLYNYQPPRSMAQAVKDIKALL